jgi:NAD(P)-dependent dehydrogenase (short-subunit alcohol dehydrogenase family)
MRPRDPPDVHREPPAAAPGSLTPLLLAAGGLAAVSLLARAARPYDLAGRTVLITGGSRGLGLVLAREVGRHGARVAICGRDTDTLFRARADLERRGVRTLAVPCDVTVRGDVETLVREVTEHLGPVDVLINNAGAIGVGPVESMEVADFQEAMATNFWGALYAILAVLPDMRRRGHGRIANIASIGGKIGVPHLVPYSASKFALVGLSEGLRAELAKDGITIVTICPGLMRTGSPRHATFKGRHRAEYAWFSISDSLPGLSMDTARAARQIVGSIRRGHAERVLSVPAKIAVLARALLPGLASDLLAGANRLLPSSTGASGRRRWKGEESTSGVSPSILTVLGERAARRNNQVPEAAS